MRVRTLDGLHLAGTLAAPAEPAARAVVLVHGGGVTREEGGFFSRLATGLADAGVASLRFDLRGHGESEGRQEFAGSGAASALLGATSPRVGARSSWWTWKWTWTAARSGMADGVNQTAQLSVVLNIPPT